MARTITYGTSFSHAVWAMLAPSISTQLAPNVVRMRSFSPCVRTNWSPDATRPSTHATSGATARTASSAALRRRSSAGKNVMPRLGTSPGA